MVPWFRSIHCLWVSDARFHEEVKVNIEDALHDATLPRGAVSTPLLQQGIACLSRPHVTTSGRRFVASPAKAIRRRTARRPIRRAAPAPVEEASPQKRWS